MEQETSMIQCTRGSRYKTEIGNKQGVEGPRKNLDSTLVMLWWKVVHKTLESWVIDS